MLQKMLLEKIKICYLKSVLKNIEGKEIFVRKKFCFCYIFFALDRNPFLQTHSFIFIAAWRTLLKLNKLGKKILASKVQFEF
jgi:hypothetical protein